MIVNLCGCPASVTDSLNAGLHEVKRTLTASTPDADAPLHDYLKTHALLAPRCNTPCRFGTSPVQIKRQQRRVNNRTLPN